MSKIKIFIITLILLAIVREIGAHTNFESARLAAFTALLFGAGVWAVIVFLTDTTENKGIVEAAKVIEGQSIEDDSALYLDAMNELKNSPIEATWVKCFAEADGDKSKAEALYIKARVKQLKK